MRKAVQLRISAPCSANWEQMRPEGKDRYCRACSKTVVDFSLMDDREIISYLSRAGQQVCGRLAADQMGRSMVVGTRVTKRNTGWWHWLVAALLVSSEATAQRQPAKPAVGAHQIARNNVPQSPGTTAGPAGPDSTFAKDTIRIQELAAVEVVGYPAMGKLNVTGLMSTVTVETIGERLRDTLASIGLLPKKVFNIYPNPVRRGSALMVAWSQTAAGVYEVSLFNAQGAMVEQRLLHVNGKDQVDLIAIPPSLPAGVYLLRLTTPGEAKAVTRKVMVL